MRPLRKVYQPSLAVVLSGCFFLLALIFALCMGNIHYSTSEATGGVGLSGLSSELRTGMTYWLPGTMGLFFVADVIVDYYLQGNDRKAFGSFRVFDVLSLAVAVCESVVLVSVVALYWLNYADTEAANRILRILASLVALFLMGYNLELRYAIRGKKRLPMQEHVAYDPYLSLIFAGFAIEFLLLDASVLSTLLGSDTPIYRIFYYIGAALVVVSAFVPVYVLFKKKDVDLLTSLYLHLGAAIVRTLAGLLILASPLYIYEHTAGIIYLAFYWGVFCGVGIAVGSLCETAYFGYLVYEERN